MATRLYITNSAAGYTPPTIRGAWTDSSQTGASKLGTAKAGVSATAADTNDAQAPDEDHLLRRFVSDTLDVDQTISGAFTGVIGCVDSNAVLDVRTRLQVFVTVGDSDTVRGTLLADATVSADWGTTAAGTAISGSLSSVSAQGGDRIVVELGAIGVNDFFGQGGTYTAYYGATGSTDLVDANTAVTTNPGWFDFPGTLTFGEAGPPTVTGTATAALGALTSSAAGAGFTPTTGTAAAGLGSLTASAVGVRATAGTGSAPLGALSSATSGTRAAAGTATAPLGGLTSSAAGHRDQTGTVSAPLGGVTSVAAGQVAVAAVAAATLGALAATASGVRTTGGTATAVLGSLDATATAAPPVPTVSAGPDVTDHPADTAFTRTPTEDDNGSPITTRSWTIVSGPAGVGTTIG